MKLLYEIAKANRNYELYVEGKEKIDFFTPHIFVANHSNSRDFYTVCEVFDMPIHCLAARDSLNFFVQEIFKLAGCVLIDRRDKLSCRNGIDILERYLSKGENVFIMPEGTWNLHPARPMLPMKHGAVKLSQKTGKSIVPVIFEYWENKNGTELCEVKFGDEIKISKDANTYEKTSELRDIMATMRWEIWEKRPSILRSEFALKAEKEKRHSRTNGKLFHYNSKYENQFILGSEYYIYENYPLNSDEY